MKKFDSNESYPIAFVNGKPYLYADYRIDTNSIPRELFKYECAVDDDGEGRIARIQPNILVNFYATIIGKEALPLDEEGVYWPRMDAEYHKALRELEEKLEDVNDSDEYEKLEDEFRENHTPDDDEVYPDEDGAMTLTEYLENYDQLVEDGYVNIDELEDDE